MVALWYHLTWSLPSTIFYIMKSVLMGINLYFSAVSPNFYLLLIFKTLFCWKASFSNRLKIHYIPMFKLILQQSSWETFVILLIKRYMKFTLRLGAASFALFIKMTFDCSYWTGKLSCKSKVEVIIAECSLIAVLIMMLIYYRKYVVTSVLSSSCFSLLLLSS